MKYVFEIEVRTDGDFSLEFVPVGMSHDDESYSFRREYNDRKIAIEDINSICSFLKSHMHTHRDYVREMWNDTIDRFIKALKESVESGHEYVSSYMSGNYDGTEFIFYTEYQYAKFKFRVTDEELKMIKGKRKLTEEEIKNAILSLYKEDKTYLTCKELPNRPGADCKIKGIGCENNNCPYHHNNRDEYEVLI